LKNYCILGNPIAHSKSPKIYDYIFKKLNINAVYDSYCIESDSSFKDFILKRNHYSGYNITSPFKNLAYNLADEVHSSACLLNAVNCIKINSKKMIGYNTDYYGFKMLMERQHINFINKKFLILGNGSTARTVSLVLNSLYNAEIYIWGRNNNHVNSFIGLINDKITGSDSIRLYKKSKADEYILINCLPINMSDSDIENIFNSILFQNIELLIDVNYINNKLVDRADEINIKTILGHDMLLYQALKNLEIWFGEKINKIDFKTLKENIFKQ